MQKEKMVLFDYDGVLADSFPRNLEAGREAARRLGHSILPTESDLHSIREMSYVELGRVISLPEEKLPLYSDTCLQVINDHKDPIKFFADVEPALRKLHTSALLGIVTSNRYDEVSKRLKHAGLDHLFGPILGIETNCCKSEKIRKIMDQEQIGPSATYMIGDAASDIREANEAGVLSVGATWGYQPREVLETASPDYIIDSLSDLPGLVFGS